MKSFAGIFLALSVLFHPVLLWAADEVPAALAAAERAAADAAVQLEDTQEKYLAFPEEEEELTIVDETDLDAEDKDESEKELSEEEIDSLDEE